jgi:hypothetical protein
MGHDGLIMGVVALSKNILLPRSVEFVVIEDRAYIVFELCLSVIESPRFTTKKGDTTIIERPNKSLTSYYA